MKGFQQVNIFVASSGELEEERKELIHIINSINKIFAHLKLEVIEWETDLESGSYQKENIQEEIDPLLEKSQIVIVIFYSKIGKFTLEEYNLAIKKKKKVFLYFKKGFSTENIDEFENYKKVLEFRERVEKENKALYRVYENIDQFKHLIQKDLSLYLTKTFPPSGEAKIQKFLTPKPAKTIDLIGREEELKDITNTLERTDRVLLVNGLGGVGKTELCKRYFWDNIDNYIHLAWVDVVGNIRESFVNTFYIEGIGFSEGDSMDERFEKILSFLNGLDKNSLLMVDNIENPKDEDLGSIRALPFKVIANSRLNLDGFETHTLNFLSPEKCKVLFYMHYKGKKDDEYVEKIVERCGSHTLSVELLARTAQNAALPIKSLFKKLENKGFNLNDVIGDKVHTFWHKNKERKHFFNHLLKIFDLSGVTKGEVHILTNLSVLPPIYISIADLSEWMELKTKEDINSLVFKGWLKQEEFNIFMHQVIQEVIRHKTSPDVEKCKNTIISLAKKLYLKPGENPINKKEYIILAETLLQHIDENDKDLANLSNNLASRYQDLGSPEKALEFQVKALKIYKEVLDENHPSLATSYNNLSTIYTYLGQPKKAFEFQLKAVKIREQLLDKNHPDLATSYNNLALIYQDLDQPEKTLEFQLKALKIYKEVLDENHPSLATSFNNLALVYYALGQPEKALEFQLKAVKIREQVLDKNHPSLATSYNNLAMIYQDLKNYKSAVQYGEKAVAILQRVFPEGHPNLDAAKENLDGIKEEMRGKRRAFKNL